MLIGMAQPAWLTTSVADAFADVYGQVYVDKDGYLYRGPEYAARYDFIEKYAPPSGWMRFGNGGFKSLTPDPNRKPSFIETHLERPAEKVADAIERGVFAVIKPYVPWGVVGLIAYLWWTKKR